MPDWENAFATCPLVAILRGLRPDEALAHGRALTGAGFTLLEVPLNSPEPLDSIARLAADLPDALVGAGTVLSPADVRAVGRAGGRLIVAPNFDPEVAAEAARLALTYLPGIGTVSEAFAALKAGAAALKLFPAEMIPPAALRAMRSVLPAQARLLPVGGIDAQTMRAYLAAGADGFGLGSSLYRPGQDARETAGKAAGIIEAYDDFKSTCAG
ncbi:2-dehydro-3-deoxy-6-phosphogalactonate aldolase [Paracoccus sp. MKU1]|uniref:2-dehydro-3-deoxy-6-phosphogalactonate aldolase n=1 Tax=Paracoccus sp. MKU1 TaxID=1745182 RepID=UPI0007191AE9|nr:2-dehydro-3-deoxy-6-phosphogalactonate aldolase [Paracoccus sp. MKU1]KRW97568.1 2-dehydro-3-deoxy-6-phosphogalactonate aldolase [Paracoccus sp. MKU1]